MLKIVRNQISVPFRNSSVQTVVRVLITFTNVSVSDPTLNNTEYTPRTISIWNILEAPLRITKDAQNSKY